MVSRHYKHDYRLVCVTDDATGIKCETYPIWHEYGDLQNPNGFALPSCYRRLRIFDSETTRTMGIPDGTSVFSMDLDIIIMSDLQPLFEMAPQADFVGWKGVGTFKPVVYNGSLFCFKTGKMDFLWKEFDPKVSPREAKNQRYFGSDQAWLSYRLDGSRPGWDREQGVYSYARDVRGVKPPEDSTIISFNGKHKPWMDHVQESSPWIRDHWRQ